MKDQWIKELAAGQSFIDVGGLWGTINERVSVAIKAGASCATMADIQPASHPLWDKFRQRCTEMGVSGFGEQIVDITQPEATDMIGITDIVHCSGVLYHLPDPLLLLHNLRTITGRYLIIGSATIPSTITFGDAEIITRGGTAHFVPALDTIQTTLFSRHFEREKIQVLGLNSNQQFDWYHDDGRPNYAPWWWLFTADYVESLLELCGFEVVNRYESWPNKAHCFLCHIK